MTSKTDAHKALFRTLGDFVQRLVDEHFKVGSLAAVCRWLVASALVLGVTACASVPSSNADSSQIPVAVPGTGVYCLREIPAQDFARSLQDSYAIYGPYKRGKLWGDSSICDLNHFYTYSVRWTTNGGQKVAFDFDIEQLMRQFFKENPNAKSMSQFTRSPRISIEYHPERVEVFYSISQYAEGGADERGNLIKPAVVKTFTLLNQPLAPATLAVSNN